MEYAISHSKILPGLVQTIKSNKLHVLKHFFIIGGSILEPFFDPRLFGHPLHEASERRRRIQRLHTRVAQRVRHVARVEGICGISQTAQGVEQKYVSPRKLKQT